MIKGEDDLSSTAQIIEMARDMGIPRGDMMEVCVWEEGIGKHDGELFFPQAIHQENKREPWTEVILFFISSNYWKILYIACSFFFIIFETYGKHGSKNKNWLIFFWQEKIHSVCINRFIPLFLYTFF